MAIQKSVTTQHGLVANNAYHKVENVTIRNKTQMEFNVKVFSSKEQSLPFEMLAFSCAYDMQGDNPLRQAYTYVKTLPDFAGSTDC
jgi:galactose mutarotase-like enzyme